MNDDVIILPTEEEKEQARAEFRELMKWSKSLFDKQTKEVLVGLNWALSEKIKFWFS